MPRKIGSGHDWHKAPFQVWPRNEELDDVECWILGVTPTSLVSYLCINLLFSHLGL